MTKQRTTEQSTPSGPAMAQTKTIDRAPVSRFSAAYWEPRVVRRTYVDRSGQTCEVQEYSSRIAHGGKRSWVQLGTNDRGEAGRRAAKVYRVLQQQGWDAALAQFKPDVRHKEEGPTVGEFLGAVERVWTQDKRTVRNYAICLRWFFAHAHRLEPRVRGRKVKIKCVKAWRQAIDSLALSDLTPKQVQAVILERIAATGSNPVAKARAKRSTASMARQAKSLFAPDLLKLLPFENICSPFAGVTIESARPLPYSSFIDAPQLLRDARKELGESDPEAYKVILLCLGAGLRREEADTLTWPQVDGSRNIIRVDVTEHFDPKTEQSSGTVPVDAGLIAELNRYRDAATELFVLEGKAPKPDASFSYYRAEESEERAIAWLKAHGVRNRKPLQTLRKEAGSLVNAAAGIHAASRFLRHSNITTTATFYVDNRTGATVPVGGMLGTKEKSEGQGTATS